MKIRWLALVCFAATMWGADVGVEFVGVMGSGRDVRVSLTNKANAASQWVAIGRDFAGYTVARYDSATETVVLAKDGTEFRLPLKQGKTKMGGPGTEPPEPMKKAILNNLRQLAAAADQYYLENGKSRTTYDDLVGPTKYVKSVTPFDGEEYRQIAFEQGKTMTVTTRSGFSVSYAP